MFILLIQNNDLDVIETRLVNLHVATFFGETITVNPGGYADFTINISKSGYTCISATLQSTGAWGCYAIGGGLSDISTFIGTVGNNSNTIYTARPIVSCVYMKK